MERSNVWKWILFFGMLIWSLMLVYPPSQKIKLGLDLKGGTSFILEVQETNTANVAKAQESALKVIRNRVDGLGISEPVIYPEPNTGRIIVQIPGIRAEEKEAAVRLLQSAAFLTFQMVHDKNDALVDALGSKGLAPAGFKMVSTDVPDMRGGSSRRYYLKREAVADQINLTAQNLHDLVKDFQAPAGYELLLEKSNVAGQTLYRPYFVSKRIELTGTNLINARVEYGQAMDPQVDLQFDSKGARLFERVTSDYAPGGARNPNQNHQRYMAIVLDYAVHSAPYIKTAIMGGKAVIEGRFTAPEAQELAIALRAGSLPVPVKVMEQRTVDPTLGKDSIDSGKMATLYGCLAVFVFMMFYYRVSGIIADLCLLFNLLLLPLGTMATAAVFSMLTGAQGGLSLPTLTLPGIAGIALTIGMAVDANVLIYERIREELAAGKTLRNAIAMGYTRAFSAIFDSNLTTVLSAIILFWLGTGPVRGYALTLTGGLLISMFTAIVVTRMLFNLLTDHTSVTTLKMVQWVKTPKFDYLKVKVPAAILSLVIIVGSWAFFVHKGEKNFGVDFTGGTAVVFSFKEKLPTRQLEQALQQAGVAAPVIQYQKSMLAAQKTGGERLDIKVGYADSEKVRTLVDKFPDAGLKVLQEEQVGPQVGKELMKSGLLAILLSLVGMIIYISWRFEFSFSIGAVVALVHDVFVTIGLFCLLGNQLSMGSLAAVLTIIGYSINDTIVIFDRIREDRKLYPGMALKDVCNLSMNQTLSRTLLTSFATMLTVIALLVFGGGSIQDFALTMFIGMISGTYSTVYIATPVMLLWHRVKKSPGAALSPKPVKA